MAVPICNYEIHNSSYQRYDGKWHHEAVAMIRPCISGCAGHAYLDFEDKLSRIHPGLHLGFDLRKQRWLIYKWSMEVEEVVAGNDLPKIRYARKFMDEVLTLEWAVAEKTAAGGRRAKFYFREFGDWVLKELAFSDPDRFTRLSGWIDRVVANKAKRDDERLEKQLRKGVQDIVDDAMTLADKGNPHFVRTAVRVSPKYGKKGRYRKELVPA